MAKTHFIWDELSDNVLMETDELGAVQAEYTQEPGLYGSVVSQKRDDDTSFYHFDGQGSTRALTDSDQNVTDTATYTAFGEDVEKTGTTENPWGYKGALGYYANTGNDLYVRARHLAPSLGRWLSEDPLGMADAPNPYLYTHNNAINRADPSGLSPIRNENPFPEIGSFYLPFDATSYAVLKAAIEAIDLLITGTMNARLVARRRPPFLGGGTGPECYWTGVRHSKLLKVEAKFTGRTWRTGWTCICPLNVLVRRNARDWILHDLWLLFPREYEADCCGGVKNCEKWVCTKSHISSATLLGGAIPPTQNISIPIHSGCDCHYTMSISSLEFLREDCTGSCK